MKAARWIYGGAGIYGLLVLFPGLFSEARLNTDWPPALTHPEFYYGFYGSALVWQLLFLMIAREPARYRALMPVTILENWPSSCHASGCGWMDAWQWAASSGAR